MEMHQVRYFLAMARVLSFTRAADECNVTQPSLTRAIQKLEEEFGGPLFRRERSRTHLTDLGRLMLPCLERTYEAAQFAKDVARGAGRTQVTPLALGIASVVRNLTLDTVIAEIGGNLPGFELGIVSGSSHDLIEAALNGALDLIIVEAPDTEPERFESWPLYSHSYHMITHRDHPLATRDVIRLNEVRAEVWIDCSSDGTARLRELAAERGFAPNVRHHASTAADLHRLIAGQLGSAFGIPSDSDRDLACIRFADDDATRLVVLAAIAGRQRSTAAAAFVKASRARRWGEA